MTQPAPTRALLPGALGGLIMWIPGGMFFLIPVIGLLVALLNNEERPARPAPAPVTRQEHASGGPG